ncbi:hypothetical protein OZX73_05325 [Bifidobacterium sp. ESL0775]|uniref:hypothetical protein n=1 Tax=Bifidobacterium sp. ESL0775 TaxID=2983230 RepID=UPI0023F9F9B4|nr:hypothetical protein [Bifidobacterium sp. ESL0775]WEV68713.1 hypothetical protein OZX73_05325 [Bifidobacterium sp. ESL0775]
MRITLTSDVDTIVLSDSFVWRHDVWGIKKDGIQGLLGTPQYKESFESIPQQDGDYWPSRLTQKGRTITLDCEANRLSSVEAAQAVRRVCDLFGRRLTITVEDANGRYQLTGALADDPSPTMHRREQGFGFGLVLYCPDPHKYGDWASFPASGGSIRVSNAGNVATWPIVEADSVSSFTLDLNGQRVVWSGSPSWLRLDFADMMPSQGVVGVDDAFRIPPGDSTVNASYSGSGLRMLVRPAWR